MHLSRADGLLWLVLALLASLLLCSSSPRRSLWRVALVFAVTVCGYLLIMAPWFLRNMSAFGSLLAPGGSKMLWLTSYDQIFSYPATSLTFAGWLDSGWKSILSARLWALGLNLANTLSVQGGIFLLPFILIGLWQVRKEKVIGLAIFAWLMTFAAMTVAFPFAGARGGFFHSGAALQVVWWAAAPLGLERIIQWGSKHRGWREAGARSVFAPGLVGLTVLFTILVLFLRLPNWNNEAAAYRQVDSFLQSEDATAGEVVVVSNPPGFYLASSRSAISVPDGTLETILELGERYDAAYLILEEGSTPAGLLSIYDSPAEVEGLSYLGEVEGARVYAIEP